MTLFIDISDEKILQSNRTRTLKDVGKTFDSEFSWLYLVFTGKYRTISTFAAHKYRASDSAQTMGPN